MQSGKALTVFNKMLYKLKGVKIALLKLKDFLV